MSVIQELEQQRAGFGFTQKAMAEAMHVAPSVLSRATKGNPTQSFLDRYRAALDELSRKTTPGPIAARHHVDELYLFGSMARGEGQADSDIDLIYHMDSSTNPVVDRMAFGDELEQAFGRPVDLVRKEYLTDPKDDRLSEIQRVLFVNSVTSHPMFRIV
ncbi:nucleotidyltransferase domain-containing protein [Bifidobacterium saeculare]|uniref:nucleotidyltransferase domain-containing protein n=1 Tax=Bifidobacterium pullorum TaxID=78448 RepID=UPI0018764283|nr:nucleotidyltransferase domain-containing protein [Bifidobacterium pullorum]MBE5065718.1 nucleotidyltransferase domain-containing protein [Bifidobacterium pullorum subsp. saeculare]